MTVSDIASLAAVAISLVALASQGVSAFRRRRKLDVKLFQGKTSETEHGITIEFGYVMVVANALGGAIGVSAVMFELDPKPEALSWGGLEDDWAEKLGGVVDPMSSRSAIQEGDTATWHFRLDITGDAVEYEATAIVILTDGKKIRTRPITVLRKQMGWEATIPLPK